MIDRPLCRHCGPDGRPPRFEDTDPASLDEIRYDYSRLDERDPSPEQRMSTAEVQALTIVGCAVLLIVGVFAVAAASLGATDAQGPGQAMEVRP